MKAYIATFHGDIEYDPYQNSGLKPMADSSLEGLLNQIVEETGWGEQILCCNDVCETGTCESIYSGFTSPDPEDDKVEIWEVNGETKEAKIVWGFWGWHWRTPDDLDQGILPGHTKSLYTLAMEDY